MVATEANDRLTVALGYLRRGWSVIPMEPGGKRPLVAWRAFQTSLASAEVVEGWFTRWPGANVGLVTGRVSGLVVLDVDARHGGGKSLAALEQEHGALPVTLEASTGGGGRHLYFRHPGPPVMNRVGLRPGIDVRGDGGCVVAPPSVHPSGRRYAWVPQRSPDEAPLALLPPWMVVSPDGVHKGHTPAHWRSLVRSGVVEGQRNASLASLSGHLLARDVDPEVALELLLAWNRLRCRPPLDDAEVVRVVDSITRLHQRERGTDLAR
jgi:hypothetical protein